MTIRITFFLFLCCGCSKADKEIKITYPLGGYDFVTPGNDTFFAAYPLKKIMSRSDSFRAAIDHYYFFKAFDEKNLSLRPALSPVFRLVFTSSVSMDIITLSENIITVKQWRKGMVYPQEDETKLSEEERRHYYIFRKYFPLDEINVSEFKRQKADSLLKLYPQLISPAYYRSLLGKMINKEPYTNTFSVKRIVMKPPEYNRLVNKINVSGYWNMPYDIECKNGDWPNDASMYTLEANTGAKYNYVKAIECGSGNKTNKFELLCKEIMKLANLRSQNDL